MRKDNDMREILFRGKRIDNGEMGSRVFTASLENGVEVIGNVYDNPELTRENKQLSLV